MNQADETARERPSMALRSGMRVTWRFGFFTVDPRIKQQKYTKAKDAFKGLLKYFF